MTKKTLVILTPLILILTSCLVCAPICNSEIVNSSDKDIIVVLKPTSKKYIDFFKESAKLYNPDKYNIDTLNNLITFILPPSGRLNTYTGPGENPARLINYLKIITQKEIIELSSQDKINDLFDKDGILYTITID